ncbi:MAG: hypothetical protein GF364_20235 [Candidatus Lokiarchaeota archaeon]|nr:hypothetical protein [Candidatus Lokiarchaeota archaeon]
MKNNRNHHREITMSEEASDLLREISCILIEKAPNGVSANALKEKMMQ